MLGACACLTLPFLEASVTHHRNNCVITTWEENHVAHVSVGEIPVWPLSVRHHLPHDHPVAPHVTGGRELPVSDGLRSCPADWNLATLSANGKTNFRFGEKDMKRQSGDTVTTWKGQSSQKEFQMTIYLVAVWSCFKNNKEESATWSAAAVAFLTRDEQTHPL